MTQTAAPPTDGYQSSWPTEPAGPAPTRRSRLGFVHELPALLVIAFAIAVLSKTFLIQAFFIPSGSMEPTLREGDRVLVNKLAYRFREPRRGEVIVFIAEKDERERGLVDKVKSFLFEGLGVRPSDEETDFIKRIVGLPGDTIEVTDSGVFVTPRGGTKIRLDEPYIRDAREQGPRYGPFVVPDDSVFVMGDNRNNSRDSRMIGPVKKADIIGKAFVKIWPPSRVGPLHWLTEGVAEEAAGVLPARVRRAA